MKPIAMAQDVKTGVISVAASTIRGDRDGLPVWRHNVIIQGVTTVWAFRAARLFCRLFEMVRSMMAPQLMHFQA